MSCYLLMLYGGEVALAADNRRRIFDPAANGGQGEVTLLSDAHKLWPLGPRLWMTGVGLAPFLSQARAMVKEILVGPGEDENLQNRFVIVGDRLRRLREGDPCGRGSLALEEGVHSKDVEEKEISVLITGIEPETGPFWVEFRSKKDFTPLGRTGSPRGVVSPLAAIPGGMAREEYERWLGEKARQLHRMSPVEARREAEKFLSEEMARIAKIQPDRVTACGDLVFVRAEGSTWVYF